MDGFEAFEHLFIGADPLRLAAHGRTLETISFHAGRYWPLEAALWDLAGQAMGVPVATLLGGATDRIPAYASLGELRSPQQRGQDARDLVAAGFQAVKVRIARGRIAEGIAVVAAIRDAVDDALEIMVDLNQWWRMAGDIAPGLTPQGARGVVERLREHDVLWVEEPLAGDDLAGMRMLREQTGVRISGGEMARTFDELQRALTGEALDVVQPDVVLSLGIGGARTLAELALRSQPLVHTAHLDQRDRGAGQPARLLRRRRRAVPRVPLRPAGLDARSGVTSCSPSRSRPTPTDSCTCRTRPGLGITLDEDRISHYEVS